MIGGHVVQLSANASAVTSDDTGGPGSIVIVYAWRVVAGGAGNAATASTALVFVGIAAPANENCSGMQVEPGGSQSRLSSATSVIAAPPACRRIELPNASRSSWWSRSTSSQSKLRRAGEPVVTIPAKLLDVALESDRRCASASMLSSRW